MYNIRIKRFGDSNVQVSLYSKLVQDDDEREVKKKKREPREWEHDYYVNPWTGEVFDGLEEFYKNESLRVSYIRTINNIYDVARCNKWEWFLTFTFSPEKVKDRYDYKELSKVMSKWLSHMRERKCPDMVYLVVPEQHKDGAWHFHGLFRNIGGLTMVDRGLLDDQDRIIYNIQDYKLGWTTATKVGDAARASSYLLKYITKELCAVTPNMRRYWASKNCERPSEEFCILEGDYLEKVQMLFPESVHMKSVENEFQKVTYFEYRERPAELNEKLHYFSLNCPVFSESE